MEQTSACKLNQSISNEIIQFPSILNFIFSKQKGMQSVIVLHSLFILFDIWTQKSNTMHIVLDFHSLYSLLAELSNC